MRKVEKRRTFFLFDFLCILPLLCGLFFKLPYIRVFLKKFDGILFFFLTSLTGIRGKRSFGLGNVYWTFNLQAVFCLFETLKMFYPSKGLCEAEPEWGPFYTLSILLCLEKGVGTFKFTGGERPF